MANKSLLIKDINDLNRRMNNSIKYLDLDYSLTSAMEPWTTHTRSLELKGDYAVLNAYRLWLQSKKYDYIRSPSFGGLFDAHLNDRVQFKESNEEAVKSILIEETGEKWPDITVLDCFVKANIKDRRWEIRIVAQDKNSKLILKDDKIYIDAEE